MKKTKLISCIFLIIIIISSTLSGCSLFNSKKADVTSKLVGYRWVEDLGEYEHWSVSEHKNVVEKSEAVMIFNEDGTALSQVYTNGIKEIEAEALWSVNSDGVIHMDFGNLDVKYGNNEGDFILADDTTLKQYPGDNVYYRE